MIERFLGLVPESRYGCGEPPRAMNVAPHRSKDAKCGATRGGNGARRG